MKYPKRIEHYIKTKYKNLTAIRQERFIDDIIDTMTGNKEGNLFEKRICQIIFPELTIN